MCGIVGALSFQRSNFAVTEPYIVKMRDTMQHRGPDGCGTWIGDAGRIGLGHRRLAIIDRTEAANQPMCNEDGTVWITFNGEIYNHAEIRAELESIGGHRWATDHSDTEVIVHAFEEWGIDCINRFRGMFAFAIWDSRKRELWLVRDRIGVKPLYYSIHHGRITFASEIKALLQDPDQRRMVNEESLYHFLSFLTAPAPDTLFDGIKKLPGGCWLRVTAEGHVEQRRYWDVWDHTTPLTDVSDEEISERLLAELRTAVQYRAVSDVPVGVFLSGGIDSSTNAALFSEQHRSAIDTFTIGYDGQYETCQNETHFAKMMADRVGANYHERLLSIDDLLDFIPQMVYLQDEPIADPVCVPVYYVSKLARDRGVTVCQVGEGADELFWGYSHWKTMLRLQQLSDLPVPNFLRRSALVGLQAIGKGRSNRYEYIRRSASGQPVFWGGADVFNDMQKQQLLSPRMRRQFDGYTSWEALRPLRQRFEQNAWETSHLNWMSYVDLNVRLPELLLMRVDKMAMGTSLEGRVPFLDHKFVELAMSIPAAVKTRNGVSKHILKKAVRGVIPDELIDRKKQGFGVPIYEWFFDRLGDKIRVELDEFCQQTDLLDRKQVMSLLDQPSGPMSWYLLNLAMWWKQFIA